MSRTGRPVNPPGRNNSCRISDSSGRPECGSARLWPFSHEICFTSYRDVHRQLRSPPARALSGAGRRTAGRAGCRVWPGARRVLVIAFQAAVMALLAWRGFPGERLAIHGAVLRSSISLVCRYPSARPSTREHTLARAGRRAAGVRRLDREHRRAGQPAHRRWAWGCCLRPLWCFGPRGNGRCSRPAALALLLVLVVFSATPAGARWCRRWSRRGGQPSLEYLPSLAGAPCWSPASWLSSFWSRMTADYDRVAVELGTRREELCSRKRGSHPRAGGGGGPPGPRAEEPARVDQVPVRPHGARRRLDAKRRRAAGGGGGRGRPAAVDHRRVRHRCRAVWAS